MLQLSRNVFSSQSAAMRFDAVLVVHEAPSFARFLVSVFCSIGGMSSRSARVDYQKLHRASTADVLPIAKRRRQFVVSDGCFDVSHVLAKRKAGKASDQFCTSLVDSGVSFMWLVLSFLFQTTEYLVKWEGYSRFESTWVASENLSSSLIRWVCGCVHSCLIVSCSFFLFFSFFAVAICKGKCVTVCACVCVLARLRRGKLPLASSAEKNSLRLQIPSEWL